jgi:biopolymer transport protein TolR
MAMSSGSGRGPMAEINVTPLVDVMLVLVIIFMVTAPMMNNSGINVDLPKAETPPLEISEDQLVLTMDAERKVYINEDTTGFTLDELPGRLRAIAEANPERPVFLRADGALAYRDVVGLLEIAKRAGMPRVGLVFDPTDPENGP